MHAIDMSTVSKRAEWAAWGFLLDGLPTYMAELRPQDREFYKDKWLNHHAHWKARRAPGQTALMPSSSSCLRVRTRDAIPSSACKAIFRRTAVRFEV